MKSSIRLFMALAVVTASVVSGPFATAQEQPMVEAEGKEVLKRWPSQLVMRLDLIGRAGSMDDALAALEKRKEVAKTLLTSLGAEMDTVEYGDPTTTSAASQGQEQIQAMIRERIQRSGGSVPAGLKVAESTVVTLPLTARWELDTSDPVKLLQQATVLRKKIEDADIGGAKSQKLSLAEQELLEEAEAYGYDPYSDEPQAKPGEPVITFAAKITEEERSQAMKAAFEASVKDAKELAAAAGQDLGLLMSLSSSTYGGMSPEEMYGYGYGRRMATPSDDPLVSEVTDLSKVSFNFAIRARFRIIAGNRE
ncbi:DUF541 domain-containing protein [Bremerella cremea]|uniref:DUF541 domain-containing protein n=1 Tax=Bremerella cremea TaxID=1031537 RepID=A0A368KXA3_9BACT|nr:SIMPL domain-containing protein [Bremerella cremea]RCS54084.1 DUF541 domain-containing protein [Bremerella cremea]